MWGKWRIKSKNCDKWQDWIPLTVTFCWSDIETHSLYSIWIVSILIHNKYTIIEAITLKFVVGLLPIVSTHKFLPHLLQYQALACASHELQFSPFLFLNENWNIDSPLIILVDSFKTWITLVFGEGEGAWRLKPSQTIEFIELKQNSEMWVNVMLEEIATMVLAHLLLLLSCKFNPLFTCCSCLFFTVCISHPVFLILFSPQVRAL